MTDNAKSKSPLVIQAQHTPGPWRYATTGNIGNCVEADSGKRMYDLDNGYRTVALVQHCCASDNFFEQEANQAANILLIAAAPMLHAVLMGIVQNATREMGGNYSVQGALIDAARGALSTATGAQITSRTLQQRKRSLSP